MTCYVEYPRACDTYAPMYPIPTLISDQITAATAFNMQILLINPGCPIISGLKLRNPYKNLQLNINKV